MPVSASTTSPQGFLAVGARTVFALSYQRFNKVFTNLMTTNMTMEDLFRIPGAKPTPEWGWVGWDPRKFDSVRTPGAKNFMDPHSVQGFLRAVTGDLTMTAGDWKAGTGGTQPPELSNFAADNPGTNTFGPGDTPFFTPNGDGVTDAMELSFVVDRRGFRRHGGQERVGQHRPDAHGVVPRRPRQDELGRQEQ